jgi:hypothetical protein
VSVHADLLKESAACIFTSDGITSVLTLKCLLLENESFMGARNVADQNHGKRGDTEVNHPAS